MIIVTPNVASPLLTRAGFALKVSQGGLAALIGASRRTISRWVGGETAPRPAQLLEIARLVYPRDAALASEIAAACHETLETLGIVVRPPPAPVEPAPAPLRPPLPTSLIVDAVVCAAAEAMSGTPQTARQGLLAAFTRAKALGLTVDDVMTALGGLESIAKRAMSLPLFAGTTTDEGASSSALPLSSDR